MLNVLPQRPRFCTHHFRATSPAIQPNAANITMPSTMLKLAKAACPSLLVNRYPSASCRTNTPALIKSHDGDHSGEGSHCADGIPFGGTSPGRGSALKGSAE